MSTSPLLAQLRALKLGGMAASLQTQLEQVGTYDALAFTERLTLLLDQEALSRDNRKQQRLIAQARFRVAAHLQDLDYHASRHLKRDQIAQLATGDWIAKGQNVLITGPCGSGKTYLACALGEAACLRDYSVRYYRLSRLFLELTHAKAEGTYQKFLQQLSKTHLLILDDWGMDTLATSARHDLMEVMDDRYGRGSTLVISQLPTDQWYATIGDNTLADAILDRLMHNAHRIQLKGESMRKKRSSLDPS